MALLIQSLLLPTAKLILTSWTWFYTMAAPEDERESRRAEIRSDLHEQISASREARLNSAEIAAQVLLRMVCGFKGDLAWCVAELSTLPCRLERGSEILRRTRAPKQFIVILGGLGMVNFILLMSNDNQQVSLWVAYNAGLPFMGGLMMNQQCVWARRALYSIVGTCVLMSLVVIAWAVIHYQLYQNLYFVSSMLGLLPILLAVVVSDNSFRTRVFGGRWKPVFVCWGILAATSLAVTHLVSGLSALLVVGALMVPTALGFRDAGNIVRSLHLRIHFAVLWRIAPNGT